ncbi:bifunctional allantoicase/(S)-ureidoglycine aminohydrolase [Paeniglutamicibacter gangotriensis]|uniref:bifunctional allantoicase/(S)-ureidoglycine aminohydrolase n=1 Tax=Paeniglutamicibacter gangotriensis TaxID=254787 RepID=UPI0021D26467|nr:bifunctional allantoicase/(S)-ureidoglycine aminohydrolase [Paeniglutamicibacter gangotriensis]
MRKATYFTPRTEVPAQTELITDRSVVTEAYTVIPRGALRDSVVSELPGWNRTATWILNRPVASGATTFSQYLLEVAAGGGSTDPEPEEGVEGFIFILEGRLTLTLERDEHELEPGGFAFLPAGYPWTAKNIQTEPAKFQWIRKAYQPLAGYEPAPIIGNEREMDASGMPGTDNKWRTTRMIPTDDLAYDMHVNIVTFEAGAVIPFAETHVMEHGLYVLEGKSVYRLNQDWVEIQEGDYVSLRAFCPQACYAGGPGNFRYLLYKDMNRHVQLT